MDLEEIDFVTIPEYLKLYNNSVWSLLSTYFKILLFKFVIGKKTGNRDRSKIKHYQTRFGLCYVIFPLHSTSPSSLQITSKALLWRKISSHIFISLRKSNKKEVLLSCSFPHDRVYVLSYCVRQNWLVIKQSFFKISLMFLLLVSLFVHEEITNTNDSTSTILFITFQWSNINRWVRYNTTNKMMTRRRSNFMKSKVIVLLSALPLFSPRLSSSSKEMDSR